MTHLHKASGNYFEVGEYRDGEKTYDITIISYWKDPETQAVGAPVELVGFYFGDYNPQDTDFYIDQWLDNRASEISVLQAASKCIDAYLIINEGVLDAPEVRRLEQAVGECQQLLYDRSWRFEHKLESAFKMNRAEYKRFVEVLLSNGEITDTGYDTLMELAINYPD